MRYELIITLVVVLLIILSIVFLFVNELLKNKKYMQELRKITMINYIANAKDTHTALVFNGKKFLKENENDIEKYSLQTLAKLYEKAINNYDDFCTYSLTDYAMMSYYELHTVHEALVTLNGEMLQSKKELQDKITLNKNKEQRFPALKDLIQKKRNEAEKVIDDTPFYDLKEDKLLEICSLKEEEYHKGSKMVYELYQYYNLIINYVKIKNNESQETKNEIDFSC